MYGDINFIFPLNKHVVIFVMDFLGVTFLIAFLFFVVAFEVRICITKLYALHAYATPHILYS